MGRIVSGHLSGGLRNACSNLAKPCVAAVEGIEALD